MPRPLSSEEIQEFRDALCRVAERLFAEHGYGGVTLRAIARELGCSAMTPYRYFENKEAIFTAVRTKAFIRHGEVFEKIAAEHRDPLERLRAYCYAYVGFARDEPHAYRIMFEIARNTELAGIFMTQPAKRREILRGWEPLVAVMDELVAAELAEGDPLILAHLAWVMLHGLVTLELSQKYLLGHDLDALIEPALATFLRGIGAPPISSGPGARP